MEIFYTVYFGKTFYADIDRVDIWKSKNEFQSCLEISNFSFYLLTTNC